MNVLFVDFPNEKISPLCFRKSIKFSDSFSVYFWVGGEKKVVISVLKCNSSKSKTNIIGNSFGAEQPTEAHSNTHIPTFGKKII